MFSPSMFSPSMFSPSMFSPSMFSPSMFSQTEIAQAFSTAQTRSIVAVSATAGLSDEFSVVNTWNRTGHFYVRVTGRGGAFNTSIPFALNVTKGVTTCAGVTDTALTPRTAVPASGLKTVIVTDSSRVALDAALPGPAGATLRNKLSAFATRSEVSGVVVDVAGDDRVRALRLQASNNPNCPFAKNLVAEEIKGIIDSYRSNPLQYVVIVGSDDAIPFFRSPDQSAIGPESGYVPPVQSNSPSEASLRLDFVLSQDRYGSKTTISLPWNDYPVPGLAVGRLVETATEIAGLIDAYVAADAVVAPSTSLVTGYDFLEDAAAAVKGELDAGTGVAGDALITPNGKSPQDPASWKAADLRAKLFDSRHDVIFLAGHFSANSALAADFATSLLTTELAASTTDFTNSIVFSAGCHSGYNLVDGDAIPGVTLPLDWAQAFARKKATLIAGTGYQYGDTDFLEYSERLYSNFARQLRAGSAGTPIAVGEALVQAKLAYLAATPDIRGLHEKALLQATLFGLPMLGVNMPAGRVASRRWPGRGGHDTGRRPESRRDARPQDTRHRRRAGSDAAHADAQESPHRLRRHRPLAERSGRRRHQAGRAGAAARGGQRDARTIRSSCCAASAIAAARTSTRGRCSRLPARRRPKRAACTSSSCRRSTIPARCGRRTTSVRWPAAAAPSCSSRRCSIAPPASPTERARSAGIPPWTCACSTAAT